MYEEHRLQPQGCCQRGLKLMRWRTFQREEHCSCSEHTHPVVGVSACVQAGLVPPKGVVLGLPAALVLLAGELVPPCSAAAQRRVAAAIALRTRGK